MYLHKKHVHPSVLAVLESQNHKRPSFRKTTSCKVIGESVVLEGIDDRGKHLITEGNSIDPILGGKSLIIPVNEQYAFVLNESENYELVRVDEALGDMIGKAVGWLRGKWDALKQKMAKWFKGPGEVDKFWDLYKKDPAAAQKHFTDRLVASGKTPQEAATLFKQAQSAKTKADAMANGVKTRDQEVLHAMSGAADAKTPEEKQAAQQKLDRAHEIALAKAQGGQQVVQGGGQGRPGPDGKPGPNGKPAQKPATDQAAAPPQPEPAPTPAAATPPAAAQPPAPAQPKEGDTVEMTDAAGTKVQGQVVTLDEAAAKKWNDQFAGTPGFVGVKAGLAVKTPKGFVPLDKNWAVAASPPVTAPAPTASDAATAAATPSPAPTTKGADPAAVQGLQAPEETGAAPVDPAIASTLSTGTPVSQGKVDDILGGQPAAEPAFDPNATMAQPAPGKVGIPSGAKQVGADTLAAGVGKRNPKRGTK